MKFWMLFGLSKQMLFSLRFLIQWVVSERARRSVIPVPFWFLSIGGSLMLLIYAIERRDPVFILGQSMGTFIYARNLFLVYQQPREAVHAVR